MVVIKQQQVEIMWLLVNLLHYSNFYSSTVGIDGLRRLSVICVFSHF